MGGAGGGTGEGKGQRQSGGVDSRGAAVTTHARLHPKKMPEPEMTEEEGGEGAGNSQVQLMGHSIMVTRFQHRTAAARWQTRK